MGNMKRLVIFNLYLLLFTLNMNGIHSQTTTTVMTTASTALSTTSEVTTFAPSSSTASPGYLCVPAEDCTARGVGALVPDPDDCERYYVCVNSTSGPVPSASSIACPSGQFFNQSAGACTDEAATGCTNDCYTINPPTACLTTCPVATDVTFIGDVSNCSVYYVCMNSVPSGALSCPTSAPYFDGDSCVADLTACCDFCSPVCTEQYAQIQDPCDCTAFFVCFVVGNADCSYRGSCPTGQFFNATSALCEVGSCTSVCSSCSTCGGSTVASGVTTTAATPDGCTSLDSYTCPSSNGNFPRCDDCDNSYFHCVDGDASIQNCPGSQVFNTNTDYPFCLTPENCPYP